MKAMLLRQTGRAEDAPLQPLELSKPEPRDGEIVLRVRACGVCHTDLHIVEGEVAGKLPIVPGHQIIGTVENVGAPFQARGEQIARGSALPQLRTGDRLGIPWLHRTCGKCDFCRTGRENLCDVARFTGCDVNGGFAEYAVVPAEFAVRIPDAFDDAHAAPLLCAGIVGYRALRLSGVRPRQKLGLYGFGASAHIAIQVARHWHCEVFVSTRSAGHQQLARELGATLEIPENSLDAAIIFAPAGQLVPVALRALRKGGTLVLAGIHMSPIPEMNYELLYHERTVRSVANATRDDARQFMKLAGQIPVRTEAETFPLAKANDALVALKHSQLRAPAAVLLP